MGRFTIEQLISRGCLRTIIDSQVNGFAFAVNPIAKNTDHQIIHAVGAKDPTDQRQPSLLNGILGHAVAIERHIHQGSCLDF